MLLHVARRPPEALTEWRQIEQGVSVEPIRVGEELAIGPGLDQGFDDGARMAANETCRDITS